MAFQWLAQPKPQSFGFGLAVSVIALGLSILARTALLGFANGLGLSATYFPAFIVVTLVAGSRWGWATLAVALALDAVAPSAIAADRESIALRLLFAISGAATVAVAGAFRRTLQRLDTTRHDLDAVRNAVQITETRFRNLADSAQVLMWVTRTDGRREFANQAYVDFLAAPYQAALDFDWREVLHPDDQARILREQVAGEGSRRLFTLEARYRRHDGEYRWVRSVSQPRWSPDGEFAGFVGVGYDVSDAKRAEADLTRINELLAERVQAALSERDEAEAALHRVQKLEAVGQLTGGVAHDFNNLLTVIIGALDLMQRHPHDEPRRARMIEAATAAARRGERLTQQLLAFSRRQSLKPEPVRVDALLADSEPLLRRAVGEAISVSFRLSAPDSVAMVDPSQFEAAIMNLAVNARDATPGGGEIRIETFAVALSSRQVEDLPAGGYLKVAVRDTGVGMDQATLARAFEPFFTTKPPGRGTGLGLSQAYGFARQSGGTATVESAQGDGATVCLYLPILEAPTPEPAPPVAMRPENARPGLRVLLAEDDAQVSELVEAMLSELGHSVRTAEHADAALAILRTGAPFDLLLTDLVMPGDRTGLDLAREAVAMRPGLPVILSSGYAGDVLNAAEEAPWPLLRKPYGADRLASVIAEVTLPITST